MYFKKQHLQQRTTTHYSKGHPMTASKSLQNLTTLVVDDDEFQLEFTSELLKQIGITNISTADSGTSALTKFNNTSTKPDLLICDLQMPGMDGFDFITELSKRRYEGALIIVSGQEKRVRHSASLVAQLSSLKYLGEIEKPVTKLQLQSFISNLLL
jgi:CheY-like chemotaxis protein